MHFGMPLGWALDQDCLNAAVPSQVWVRGRWRVLERDGKIATWKAIYRCDNGETGVLLAGGGREAWWRSAAAACAAADAHDSQCFRIRIGSGYAARVRGVIGDVTGDDSEGG